MPKLPDKKITLHDLDKLSEEERSDALEPIIKANEEDVKNAKKNGLDDAKIDRLILDEKRIFSLNSNEPYKFKSRFLMIKTHYKNLKIIFLKCIFL